jgi:hypothetical protein
MLDFLIKGLLDPHIRISYLEHCDFNFKNSDIEHYYKILNLYHQSLIFDRKYF